MFSKNDILEDVLNNVSSIIALNISQQMMLIHFFRVPATAARHRRRVHSLFAR